MGIEIARAEYVDLTRAVGLGHHIRGWHHRCGRRMCGEAPSFYSTAAIPMATRKRAASGSPGYPDTPSAKGGGDRCSAGSSAWQRPL
ncbi:hypothetical protein [Candidatus Macondimonas diazotrophica]|uniref:Uncharacterized protein n=1 Tax=Candidatus Macondimonas diazotrophica TaxID=2305248 RepID=A0A4Z0F841_9GAMM|nr:hypothetical protein [Candidatus Macondimonas diazotrophica]NCU01965.1 hypothetical protein [Candidatus Macondimonas diazotrophica]TFZ81419.1 hypothetical protein E4680_12645 [Candidatus Macondimonas diazotrophica]